MDEPVDIESLARLVKEERLRRGRLSLRAAAEQAEVPFNTLARVEKGVEKSNTTQDKLKERVGGWLAEHHEFKLATQADEAPDKFLEKRRCWTFSYERLGFHLDVLPCIPDAELETSPHGILLTDTKLRPWQHGNPAGYATWFRNRSEEMLTKIAKRALEANVADVPNWKVRSTLQRLVQVLKWHCYLHFGTDVDDRPPSILITTLAAHAYQGQSNLANALLSVTQDMDATSRRAPTATTRCSTPRTRGRTSPTSGTRRTPRTARGSSAPGWTSLAATSNSSTSTRATASRPSLIVWARCSSATSS